MMYKLLKEYENAILYAAMLVFLLALFNITLGTDKIETQVNEISSKIENIEQVNINIQKYDTEIPTRYELTNKERDYIERIVFAESGTEGLTGQILIAQCILNSCEINNIRPYDVCLKFSYTQPSKNVSETAKLAVKMVFDEGYKYIDEPIQWFYASDLIKSNWHENQEFVIQYNDVRFFK